MKFENKYQKITFLANKLKSQKKSITPANISNESLFYSGGTLSANDKDVILYCKTLLEFTDIFIHGITFIFSYSAPERDIKIGCALFYWSTNKRKKLSKIINHFTVIFPEPYWAVRRLIEGIETNTFKEVLNQFNVYSRVVSNDFLYALKTGLYHKANALVDNTIGKPYVYNCELVKEFRNKR